MMNKTPADAVCLANVLFSRPQGRGKKNLGLKLAILLHRVPIFRRGVVRGLKINVCHQCAIYLSNREEDAVSVTDTVTW